MSRSFLADIGKQIGKLALAFFTMAAILTLAMSNVSPAFANAPDEQPPFDSIGIQFGNDYLWAGESAVISNQEVSNDLLAAGRTIDIKNGEVGGSIRAAGQNVEINNVSIGENATIAGETVSIDKGKANAVWMTGRTASFTGKCSSLVMYADTVSLNGTVNGDVEIGANTIEIGPDTVVNGSLHVSASETPSIPETAKIEHVDINIVENADTSTSDTSPSALIFTMIFTIITTLVAALICEWLGRRHTAQAAEMIRTRTGATVGSGIIGALCAPIGIILLCCFVVTIPVAGFITLFLLALTCIAGGFTGASLFKVFFPKLGRFVAALIGGAITGVLLAIPVLGGIVLALAFFYTLGYVIQSTYLSMKQPAEPATPTIPDTPATPADAPVASEIQ